MAQNERANRSFLRHPTDLASMCAARMIKKWEATETAVSLGCEGSQGHEGMCGSNICRVLGNVAHEQICVHIWFPPLPNSSNEHRLLVRRQVIDLMRYYILCLRTSPVLQGAGTERTGQWREKTWSNTTAKTFGEVRRNQREFWHTVSILFPIPHHPTKLLLTPACNSL